MPMTTFKRIGRYRLHVYSNEGLFEPPHVHVEAAEDEAKFWLDPVELAESYGFNSRELNDLLKLVKEHRQELIEKWEKWKHERNRTS